MKELDEKEASLDGTIREIELEEIELERKNQAGRNAGGLRVVVHSRHLRCAGDAHELAVVEPVEFALLAAIDHDVASAEVDVCFHVLVADGAVNSSLQVAWIGSARHDFSTEVGVANLGYKVGKCAHRDHHAATALARPYMRALPLTCFQVRVP